MVRIGSRKWTAAHTTHLYQAPVELLAVITGRGQQTAIGQGHIE
jgi:hypothetical protein